MTKSVAIFFAASLLGNVACIGYLSLRVAKVDTVKDGRVEAPTLVTGLSLQTRQLLTETDTDNLEHLRDHLRAEGLPESVVFTIVDDRLWSAYRAKRDAADPAKKRPWWQQTQLPLPGDDILIGRIDEQFQADYKSRIAELFPAKRMASMDPSIASLPTSKQEGVQKLLDDYDALERKLRIESGGYAVAADRKKSDYLRGEKERDLRALLTPEEYAEVGLRDSCQESSLKRSAALLGFSEREFRGLLEINRWYGQEQYKRGGVDDPFAALPPEKEAERIRLNAEMKRREQEIIGVERTALYAEIDSSDYDQVSRLIARFDLPSSATGAYFTLKKRTSDKIDSIDRNETLSPEQRALSFNALKRSYETSIREILGPTVQHEDLYYNQVLQGLEKYASPGDPMYQ